MPGFGQNYYGLCIAKPPFMFGLILGFCSARNSLAASESTLSTPEQAIHVRGSHDFGFRQFNVAHRDDVERDVQSHLAQKRWYATFNHRH